MFTKSHERKRQPVCLSVCLSVYLSVCLSVFLSVSKESWIVYVWKFLTLAWWIIWNLYFRWINKGRKDSHQKDTSLTRVHTRFLISLRSPKLLTKKKKSRNKESVASRPQTKNKLMWCIFHNQSQFSNVIENKPWMLSLWKAFHDSKRKLHFFNKQPVYKQLTLGI